MSYKFQSGRTTKSGTGVCGKADLALLFKYARNQTDENTQEWSLSNRILKKRTKMNKNEDTNNR